MYKTIVLLSSALLMAALPARLKAQSFDTSGNASLTGQYLFRYVNFFNDENGNLVESCSLTGAIAFNGTGNYTFRMLNCSIRPAGMARATALRWAGELTECNPMACCKWIILFTRRLCSAPSASQW